MERTKDTSNSFISKKGKEKVLVTTVDDYVKENKIKKVDLIKIDVEGYEPAVMKGAKDTILRDYPILFIEIKDHTRKWGRFDTLKHLEELGYSWFGIDKENFYFVRIKK